MTDKEKIRAEVERLYDKYKTGWELTGSISCDGAMEALELIEYFIDSLPEPSCPKGKEQDYPSSTAMIDEWETNELPMLRKKDFRGDAERMAYNAFIDGFVKGLYYRK